MEALFFLGTSGITCAVTLELWRQHRYREAALVWLAGVGVLALGAYVLDFSR